MLWAYRTRPRRSTGETPFSMTYGAEAVVLVEVNLLSSKITSFEQEQNGEHMVESLDALEECRSMVAVQLSDYQQILAWGYNKKVKPWESVLGDLVLRKAIGSVKDHSVGKLTLNWEGPYHVIATVGMGAYYLEDLEERPFA